jgi:UrcA family protein
VVDISDLDLSTGWGVHVMHQRIRAAAVDACNELNNQPGLYPTAASSDADCYHHAVRRAIADAQDAEASARDVDYTGY